MKILRNVFFSASVLSLAACGQGAKSPADVALDLGYQFVGAGAMTVKAFDVACVDTARRIAGFTPDGRPPIVIDRDKLEKAIELAEKCDAAEESARAGLNLAEDALKTWSAAKMNNLGCAASRFLSAFDDFGKIGKSAGFEIPSSVTHVVDVAKTILQMTGAGGSCYVR